MSLSASSFSGDSGQLLLRWSDGSNFVSHEEFVDVLSRQLSRITVRSGSAIAQDTPVFLAGGQYIANGIARSCRKDSSNSFILGILIDTESNIHSGSARDPGIFVLEDFITEEQEAAILENFDVGPSGPDLHPQLNTPANLIF
jgi:hypothetical protein